MAHRKQLPQPRTCQQCGTTFHTARKGHVHCSSACNTRAWRQRKPTATKGNTVSGLAEKTPATTAEPSSVTLAFTGANVGTLAVGTAMGNLLSEGVKKLFAPAAAQFPTWPPAELLAAAQSPQWVADPAWGGQLWLLPTLYHGHTLHLYAEAGLPYVLWQAPDGEWRLLTTPAELQQLAATRPVSPAMRTLQQQYGLTIARTTIGTPLPLRDTSPQQLS
jgi:hypothetical protein